MKFDFFGEVRNDGVVRLMSLLEFVGDGRTGQVGYVCPESFYWAEPKQKDETINGCDFSRHLRLVGSAYVADRINPSKSKQYHGHVIKIVVDDSGIQADFSMVEQVDFDPDRTINGDPIFNLRALFGSVAVTPINLGCLSEVSG